jgi:hypothetical protein
VAEVSDDSVLCDTCAERKPASATKRIAILKIHRITEDIYLPCRLNIK